MSPEKHAIRDLVGEQRTATGELRDAIDCVILAINSVILNQNDEVALTRARAFLAEDFQFLDELVPGAEWLDSTRALCSTQTPATGDRTEWSDGNAPT